MAFGFPVRFYGMVNTGIRFVVFQYVNRILAGVEAAFAHHHFTIMRVFIAFLKLEVITLHIFIETLESLDYCHWLSFRLGFLVSFIVRVDEQVEDFVKIFFPCFFTDTKNIQSLSRCHFKRDGRLFVF